ncbi:DUF6325 family protein [Cryobacterium tagatosivorans]|uniref:DUF1269 domain-containing protein n=1 Tax=Cryobacterium tagatosivorans TaxID=1259199 RepID=A0A4R8UE79_9MICO|nr:DUF6325 family protein [Cryobacterium tagatosivorans]TFB51524.1 hypothetical protein E3O23_08300 [Cryobacterium tagatosivorans]
MLGPIEIVVIAFPGNQFKGEILPAISDLVDSDTISIVDALFVRKDADGAVEYTEFEELGENADAAFLTEVIDHIEGLISDEDVDELAEGLENDSSAAVLAFEHTWVKPLRDAIVGAGGALLESVRIPGVVVEEVLAALVDAEIDLEAEADAGAELTAGTTTKAGADTD